MFTKYITSNHCARMAKSNHIFFRVKRYTLSGTSLEKNKNSKMCNFQLKIVCIDFYITGLYVLSYNNFRHYFFLISIVNPTLLMLWYINIIYQY